MSYSLYGLTDSYYYFRFPSFFRIHEEIDSFKHTPRIPPRTTRHSMPFVSKAGTFLQVLVVTSSILTLITTTIVVVAASAAPNIGGTNDLVDVVRKIKNSKKTNANANKDNTCTMEPFLGTSQYTNCKRAQMEVEISCDTTDDTAIATKVTPTTTRRVCSYSERPVPYEDEAATTAVECGDHGSFDPATHLIMDHATGMCRLKFFRLTSTCIGVPAKSGFGVMVEVPSRTGPHHHEHNEDTHHKNNSGMLLRFSRDAGATYYNFEVPRNTVSLETSSPRRERFLWPWESKPDAADDCVPVPEFDSCYDGEYRNEFKGESTTGSNKNFFETCYQLGNEKTYCWSKSAYSTDGYKHYECRPHGYGVGWQHVDPAYVVPYKTCGDPCKKVYSAA